VAARKRAAGLDSKSASRVRRGNCFFDRGVDFRRHVLLSVDSRRRIRRSDRPFGLSSRPGVGLKPGSSCTERTRRTRSSVHLSVSHSDFSRIPHGEGCVCSVCAQIPGSARTVRRCVDFQRTDPGGSFSLSTFELSSLDFFDRQVFPGDPPRHCPELVGAFHSPEPFSSHATAGRGNLTSCALEHLGLLRRWHSRRLVLSRTGLPCWHAAPRKAPIGSLRLATSPSRVSVTSRTPSRAIRRGFKCALRLHWTPCCSIPKDFPSTPC